MILFLLPVRTSLLFHIVQCDEFDEFDIYLLKYKAEWHSCIKLCYGGISSLRL